jgi:GTP-binding protein
MLLDEFVDMKQKEIDREAEKVPEEELDDYEEIETRDLESLVSQWNKEFDRANQDPEDNSDFDSDNDINPLDTLTSAGTYTSSK